MLIMYCETCGFRIQEQELNSGLATQVAENKFNCAKCSATAAVAAPVPASPPKRTTSSAIAAQPRKTPEGTSRPTSGVTAVVRPKSTVIRTATGAPESGEPDTGVSRKPFPVVPVAGGAVVALVLFAVVFALSSGGEKPVATTPPGPSAVSTGSRSPTATPEHSGPALAAVETPEERMRRAMEETARANSKSDPAPAAPGGAAAPASGGLGMLSKIDADNDVMFNDRAQRTLKEIQDWYAKNTNDPWTYKERLEAFSNSYRSAPASQEARKLAGEVKLPQGERPPERMNWHKDWSITPEAGQLSFFEEFDGRRFVFQSHPVDQGKPCATRRSFVVPADRPYFELRMRGHEAGDHRFVVAVSGFEMLSENIGGKDWRNFTFDLSGLKGRSVDIELIHHNTGWASEFAYLQSPRFIEKPAADARVIAWDAKNTEAALARSAPGVVDLLALVDPATDAVTGSWSKTAQGLTSAKGKELRIQFPYVPPMEYDLRVVFTRKEGNNCITLVASRGDRDFLAMIGGWADKYAGFSRIGGKALDQNSSRVSLNGRLKTGQKQNAVLQVRNNGLRLLLDDQPLAEWKTNFNDIECDSSWRPRERYWLAVGTYESVYIIHAIDVVEIGAQGLTLRGVAVRKQALEIASAPVAAEAPVNPGAVAKAAAQAVSPEADYAAASDDAFSLLAKGNTRGAREHLEKLAGDSRFAALKLKLQFDLECVKLAEALPRAVAKGANSLTDGRPFSFAQTNGKAIPVGRGTKNSVKEATDSLITIEQDFGGGKALTRLSMDQLTPYTRFELSRAALQAEPDGEVRAALLALLMLRGGQSDLSPRLVHNLIESARKKPPLAPLADHLAQRFESAEKEMAAELAFQKAEQALAARKLDEARKLLESAEKEHGASAFWARNKAAIDRIRKELETALSPREKGLMFEYCKAGGNNRFQEVKLRRPETKLTFDWGDNEPAPGVDRDFSARIKGFLRVEKAGRYGFWLRADDHGTLTIDGKKVVDSPNNSTAEGEMELTAGDHPIIIEYQDTGGGAVLQVRWRLVGSFDLQDIPEGALLHDPRVK